MGEHVLGPVASQVIRMSSALAGGVGRCRQEMCGALTAGVLIIGALYGRANLEEDDGLALALAERYRSDWLAEFGHTQCEPLLDWCRGPDRTERVPGADSLVRHATTPSRCSIGDEGGHFRADSHEWSHHSLLNHVPSPDDCFTAMREKST